MESVGESENAGKERLSGVRKIESVIGDRSEAKGSEVSGEEGEA